MIAQEPRPSIWSLPTKFWPRLRQRATTVHHVSRELFDRWAGVAGEERAASIAAIRNADLLNILPSSWLLGDTVESFATEFATKEIQEVLHWPLYSYKTYATTGHLQLLFFDQNMGGATNRQGDTNMQAAGMLAGNEAMVVTAVGVNPLPALADYDVAATNTAVAFGEWTEVLNRNCWLEMIISDKTYVMGAPLALFPSGTGPGSVLGGAPTVIRVVGFPGNGEASRRSRWVMDPPLLILPQRPLKVYANWIALITVTTAGKLGVTLDGYRIRAVQ